MSRGRKRRGARVGASTRAIEALEAAGAAFAVVEYEHDPSVEAYGAEAVAALHRDPGQVYKTLLAEAQGEYLVAVVPVSHRLSLKSLARAAGHKSAELVDPATAERRTGYVVGGISPLGQTGRHRTFVDATALAQPTILVSGGRRGLDVELAGADLVRLTHAVVADLRAFD